LTTVTVSRLARWPDMPCILPDIPQPV
jgi:hypothetical protein